MGVEISYGPVMRQCTGGTPTTAATCTWTTTPTFTQYYSFAPRVRRARPEGLALLSSMTNRTNSKYRQERAYKYGLYGNYGPGDAAGGFTDHNGLMAQTDQDVIDKLVSRLKGETWNLGTFFGELPETQRFVCDVGKALWKSYKAVRRGDLRALSRIWFPRFKGNRYRGRDGKPITDSWGNIVAKPATGAIADKWLAWRYAVSPMMYDLDDAMQELYGKSSTRPMVMKVSAKSNGSFNLSGGNPSGLTWTKTAAWVKRATLYYRVNPTVAAFKRLGLLNALSVLWELTPLSFVLDWFVPVGKFLSSLDAAAGVTFIGRFLTTRESQESTVQGRHSNGMTQGPSAYTYSRWTRANSFSLTPPIPSWSPNLTSVRQFDAVALVLTGLWANRRASPG